jgi:hypothetical protein
MGANLTAGSFQVELAKANEAQAIEPPGNVPGSENPQIQSITMRALKGNKGTLWVGKEGVSANNGFELAPGDGISVDVMGSGKFFFVGPEVKDKLCALWVGP